ncbi:MAG: hypothetical protein N2651_07530 [Fimbriimonadales bacterium]|nr:hypothetical protein [Fimbriimonadales bacterium]
MQHHHHYLAVEYQERGEVRPTLVVGLGGSGIYTARRLKQLIRERYDTEGLIRFLYLDTDQGATAQEPNLADAKPEEIVSLSIAHPEQIVEEWRNNPDLHPYLEFLNGDVNVGLLRNADGAAGIRPIGRFGLHASFDTVYPRLQRAVQEIMQVEEQIRALMSTVRYQVGVVSSQPRIYIVTSLCGGTGSGIYFDTALVLRDILLKQNLDGELVGVFSLPSVFQHEAGISHSMREVIHANAYAALMELEYFCNADHLSREEWEVKYRMIPPIRISEPLVDEAYLVESANAAGRTLGSKYEVFEMTARSLLMDIGSPLGARARSAKRNSLAVIDAIRCAETGEPRLFASLAVASVAVPVKELTEYCALRVAYDKLRRQSGAVYSLASLNEAEQFLRDNGLTPEAIRKALTDIVNQPRITIPQEANLRPYIDRALQQIDEYARNLRTVAPRVGAEKLAQFREALQNRCNEIEKEHGEAEAARFSQSVVQIATQYSTQFTTSSQSAESDFERIKTQLNQIPSGLSFFDRFNANQQLKQRAERAHSLLGQLQDAYITAETNQILQQLFSSDASVYGGESVKQMANRAAEQFKQASGARQDLLAALQERIDEMEQQKPNTTYALEQYACLRRHFKKFYEQHRGALQEPLDIVLEGNTIHIIYRSGTKEEVGKRQTATDMRDLINKLARMVASGIAETVREHANVMEFLRPLYSEAPEAERNPDRPYLERKVEYLMQIAKPFWSAAQPPGDVRFEEFLAVSVPLSPNDFKYESDARELEHAVIKLTEQAGIVAERVDDGYPFALTILNRTYGARAYYLRGIQRMEHSYLTRSRNAQVRAHLHLDARFAGLPALTPVHSEAKLWWAVALATGYVAEIEGRYYFGTEELDPSQPPRPKFISQRVERLSFNREGYDEYLHGAYQAGERGALLGDSYEAAYREFTRDEAKIARVRSAFRRLSEAVDVGALNDAVNRYLEQLLQRANAHKGEPNRWRDEREALLRLKPFMEAQSYVLSHNGYSGR